MFVSKVVVNLSEASEVMALTTNTRLNYGVKKFYNIGPWPTMLGLGWKK